jgi:hypothetical protein
VRTCFHRRRNHFDPLYSAFTHAEIPPHSPSLHPGRCCLWRSRATLGTEIDRILTLFASHLGAFACPTLSIFVPFKSEPRHCTLPFLPTGKKLLPASRLTKRQKLKDDRMPVSISPLTMRCRFTFQHEPTRRAFGLSRQNHEAGCESRNERSSFWRVDKTHKSESANRKIRVSE